MRDFNLDILGGKNSRSDEKWKIANVETFGVSSFEQPWKLQVFGDLGNGHAPKSVKILWDYFDIHMSTVQKKQSYKKLKWISAPNKLSSLV